MQRKKNPGSTTILPAVGLVVMLVACGGGATESVRVPVSGPLAAELLGVWYDPGGERALIVEEGDDGAISAVLHLEPIEGYRMLRMEARDGELEIWSRTPDGVEPSSMQWLRGDDATEPEARATLLGSCYWLQQDPEWSWILEARLYGSLEAAERQGEQIVARLVRAL